MSSSTPYEAMRTVSPSILLCFEDSKRVLRLQGSAIEWRHVFQVQPHGCIAEALLEIMHHKAHHTCLISTIDGIAKESWPFAPCKR